MSKKHVIVLIGMSSSGKNAILENMIENELYTDLISHTSRPIRSESETPNKDYFFVNELEFRNTKMIETREYSTIYGSWFYGLSENELYSKLESDKIPIVILDYRGYKEFSLWCKDKDIEPIPFHIEVSFIRRTYRAFKRGNFNLLEWIRRENADKKSFTGVKDEVLGLKNLDLDDCIRMIHRMTMIVVHGE